MTLPRSMGPFDLWLFDLDGVLVDTTLCHERAYAELWGRLGLSGPPYERIAGRVTREVVREVAAHLAPANAQLDEWVRFKQSRARECLASVDVSFPDAAPCLGVLSKSGTTVALGTGASRETAKAILARQPWGSLFKAVVTGDDVALGKPAPDIHELAMSRAGHAPSRTIIIEDSEAGLESAAATQAHVASVRSGLTLPYERFVGAYPDLKSLFDSLAVQ